MSAHHLYRDELMTYAKRSRAKPDLPGATHEGRADNPLCGDRVQLALVLEEDIVRSLSVGVRGCALCQAAAKLVEDKGSGASVAELRRTAEELSALLSDRSKPAGQWPEMNMFSPVAPRKSRRRCVALPFEALADALGYSGG